MQVGGVVIPVHVSVGGVHRLISASYEENFRVADLALYRAKREGRNRVVFADPEPSAGPDGMVPLKYA